MSNFVPSDVIRASVVAGDINTPYYRVGRGKAVVLLFDDRRFLETILAALPPVLAVFAPDLSPDGGDCRRRLGPWLWDFLDALGVERAAFVVTPTLAGEWGAVAQPDGDRVVCTLASDAGGGADGIVSLVHRIVDLAGN